MPIEIIDTPFTLNLYGFSGIARNKDYAGTAFSLMNKMWKIVKSSGLKNDGKNVWIYEPGDAVFAGVQLLEDPDGATSLELKKVTISRYARTRHVGPYKRIPETGRQLNDEIKKKGLVSGKPYIEIYGHWTEDETKLETELILALENW